MIHVCFWKRNEFFLRNVCTSEGYFIAFVIHVFILQTFEMKMLHAIGINFMCSQATTCINQICTENESVDMLD